MSDATAAPEALASPKRPPGPPQGPLPLEEEPLALPKQASREEQLRFLKAEAARQRRREAAVERPTGPRLNNLQLRGMRSSSRSVYTVLCVLLSDSILERPVVTCVAGIVAAAALVAATDQRCRLALRRDASSEMAAAWGQAVGEAVGLAVLLAGRPQPM